MPTDQKLTADEAFDVADSIQAAAATALVLRRSLKSSLSAEEYEALVARETALRYDADRYRAVGITLLASTGKVTAQTLVDAIDSATETIKKIGDIRRVLNILSGLVSFGVTIAGGNVHAIIKQTAALRATIKNNSA